MNALCGNVLVVEAKFIVFHEYEFIGVAPNPAQSKLP
jgi:hypothetical protein